MYTGRVINSFGDVTKLYSEVTAYIPKGSDAMGNSITASYDPRANKLKTLLDANEAVLVEEKYDSLGRLLYTVEPEANAQYPTVKYKYITDSHRCVFLLKTGW